MSKKNDVPKYPAPFIIEAIRYVGLAVSKLLWRIEYHGTENIPNNLKGGLVIASNHQTYIDPFWIAFQIRRKFRFMAWDKACEWFIVGNVIRYLGAFPVSIDRKGTRKAMVEALKALRAGATLFIFPEGSRGFSDGQLLEFKTGTVRIAMEAGVPILPVTIRGANKVWSQDIKYPRLKKVEIFYHPLIEITKPTETDDEHQYTEEITKQLKEVIESSL